MFGNVHNEQLPILGQLMKSLHPLGFRLTVQPPRPQLDQPAELAV